MILTVCLNPAVDKTCTIDKLCPGEVNRLSNAVSVAGGKGVNVAKVLRKFSMKVAMVGFLGGMGGRLIEEALERLSVENYCTSIKGETRTNVNILGEDGCVTEILEPGPVITGKELLEFRKQFLGCLDMCRMVVLSGSMPAGVPGDFYAQLIRECHMAGCKVFLDASGEALRHGIGAGPDLIKPNKKELEFLAGRKLESLEDIKSEARKLLVQGVGKVIVSLGSDGLLYADKEQELFWEARKVKAVNTVGCGDTVVASICMSELDGDEPELALQKAVAMAAANAMNRENGCFSMEEYLDLL